MGFGGLRVGMSRAEVEALVGPPERKMGDNAWEYLTCGFGLVFGHDHRVDALLAGGDPMLNERFTVETDDGLGIGSSREQIVRIFGPPQSTSSEGQMLYYDVEGIVWGLTDDRVFQIMIRRSRPDLAR